MAKRISKFGKSVLSVILCLTMLLTTFCFFDIGSVISEAMVTVTENNKMKGSLSSQFMYAPEIAYVQPGKSTFQYFSNYDPTTGKAISTNDSTSRIEFDYKGATEVGVAVNNVYYKSGENDVPFTGALTINGTTIASSTYAKLDASSTEWASTLKPIASGTTTINYTLTASNCSLSGTTTGTTYYIQWVFRYKVDGVYHFAFMYTGVYVPLLDQAGTSTSQRYIKSGSNPTENHSWSFITGAMKYSGGNRQSQFLGTTANVLMAAPLVSFVGRAQNENNYTIPCGDGQALNENNFSSSKKPYNTFVYDRGARGANELYYETINIKVPSDYSGTVTGDAALTNVSDGTIGAGTTLGMAYIVVDTSRYTNYNQIPYLSAGYAQFYHDLDGNGNKLNSIKSVKRYYKGGTTNISYAGNIYCDVDTSNYTDHDSYSVARGLYKFNGSIVNGLVTFDTWFFNGYKHVVGYTESIGVHHYNGLYTETVDKSALRTAYNDAAHSHIDNKTYTTSSTAYSSYYTELKSVAETLCDPQKYSKTTTSLSGTGTGSVKSIESNIVNSTTTTDDYVYFYVPEVIYLKPGATSFQYYSDMSSVSVSNGVCTPTLNTARNDTTGNIYFYYKNAQKVKITQSGASSVSLSGGNVTSFNSYVNTSESSATTANITSGSVSSNSSTYITWTATYVEDNIEKTVTAKSYVYKPNVSPFVAAARKKVAPWVQTNNFCDSFAYISGVHSISAMDGTNRYPSADNLIPLLGKITEPKSGDHVNPDGKWVDSNSTAYAKASSFYDSDSDSGVVVSHAGTGTVYVDISRFSNLSQVPNLTFGFGITDVEGSSGPNYFVADYTGVSVGGNGKNTTAKAEWDRTPNYFMVGDKNSGTSGEGMKYKDNVIPGRPDLVKSNGTDNIVIGVQAYGWRGSRDALNALYLHLNVVRQDRSGLRQAVEYANKYSYALQAAYFNGSTQWTTYTTALTNAQNALTKVDGTANFGTFPSGNNQGSGLAKELKDAVDVLVNSGRGTAPRNISNYTASQTNVGLIANSDGTYTVAAIGEAVNDGTASISKSFKAYDRVEFSAEQYNGYNYVGYISGGKATNGNALSASEFSAMQNSTNPISQSKNESLEFGNALNKNYAYTFYYLLNPDVLFDNEFDFDHFRFSENITAPVTSGGSAISIDYANNSISYTSSNNDDYTVTGQNGTSQSYGYMDLIPGHTYRISYKYEISKDASLNAFLFTYDSLTSSSWSGYQGAQYVNRSAGTGYNSFTYTVLSGRKYGRLRLGVGTSGVDVTFSDIYVQDITNPDGFTDDVVEAAPHGLYTLEAGSKLGSVATISRSGYAFDGWYTSQDSTGNGIGTKYTADTIVPKYNVRLYSKWVLAPEILFGNEFDFDKVTFTNGNGMTSIKSDYATNTLSLTANTADSYISDGSTRMQLTAGHTYKVYYSFTGSSGASARCTLMPYSAASGGTWGSAYYKEHLASGDSFTVNSAYPYIFLRFGIRGATAESPASGTYSDIYVQDITNPAGKTDDITPANPMNKVKLAGETIGSLADISRSGYSFAGWYTGKNGTGTRYTENSKMPSTNTQLWPHWSLNSYLTAYNENHDGLRENWVAANFTGTVTQGNISASVVEGSKNQIKINGTTTSSFYFDRVPISLSTENTLYYVFSIKFIGTARPNTGCVVMEFMDKNGALLNPRLKLDARADNSVSISVSPEVAAKIGSYTLRVWEGNATADVPASYDNVVIEPRIEKVTSETTTATNSTLFASYLPYESTYGNNLPTPVYAGYTFNGWFTSATGGTQVTSSTATPSVDSTVYAHWTATQYKITYKYDNGSSDTTASYNIEQEITLPTPTKTGCTFIGWKVTTADGNWTLGNVYTEKEIAAGMYGNVTLTAQWTENPYTITYVNGNNTSDTKVGYKITTVITLIAAPTYDGYVFVGWKVTQVTNGNWETGTLYGAGANVGSGKYGDVTLVAQWVYVKDAETKSEAYTQENSIEIITGVDASGNKQSTTTTKYDADSFKKYTDAINAYNTAKKAIPTDVNASDYGTRLAEATKTLQNAINALVDITLNERGAITEYLNNFFIDNSATRHTLSEINLNHYAYDTLKSAKTALDNGEAIKDKGYKITDKDTDGTSIQAKINDYVLQMAKAYKTTSQVKTSGPAFKVYETASAAQNVKDANGNTLAGATAVNYVYAGKDGYTYYCYTNSTNPTVLITVDDIANGGRVCYPTTASAVANPTYSGSAKSASYALNQTIPAANTDSVYSTYTNVQIGNSYNYTQKQVIKLTPEFTSGSNGKAVYQFAAYDDALNKNVATQSALSSGIGAANEYSTLKDGTKITIVIDYHPGDAFDVTGDQVQEDKFLNQYHLFRVSGGAANWELPKTGEKAYTVNDTTYGQTDRGSFTFTYELGTTDIANGKINTTDVNELIKLFKDSKNYEAAKSNVFQGAKYWIKNNKTGVYDQYFGRGLGYQVWGTNWSFNYYPKSQSYTYVHLVDRWGNVVDKVFYVGNQDIKDVTVSTSGTAGSYTILEDGGSGINTLSLNGTFEILTDSKSSFENNVYKTTGNVIKIKTGEANKSYTLSMKDKATNASSATVTSDENGIITFSVEDTEYKNGVYTFKFNDYEINLYSSKYVLEVYDGTAEEGEYADITVITTGEVGKTRLTDTDGNTVTLSQCVTNEDGTKTWTMSKSKPAGEYEYTVSVKVGHTWYNESSVGKLTFTERVLDSGLIRSAEYDAETGLYKVTIEGRATKIQFITEDGMTRTYTRYHDSVKSRKSYDENGNEVPDIGRTLDHEVWLVDARLYSGHKYTVAGKFEAGWNRDDIASLTAH